MYFYEANYSNCFANGNIEKLFDTNAKILGERNAWVVLS